MIKSIRLIVPCINVFGHSLIIFYYFIKLHQERAGKEMN